MISMSRNQIWGILAAITAGFSFINLVFAAQLAGAIYVFTAVVFAGIFISGTASAIMIFVNSQEELNDAFVMVAKMTILVAILFQLQTAILVGNGSKIPTGALVISILYLIGAIGSLGALFIWAIMCDAERR